jgi:hypothetical protein
MDAETKDKVIKDEIQKELDFEAQIGRSFAHEFISCLANVAGDTLREWLKKNNCPGEAVELLDNVIILERDAIYLENHTLGDWDARGLTQEVGNITERIAKLGGVFQSKFLISYPRESVIAWQPGEVIKTENDDIDG